MLREEIAVDLRDLAHEHRPHVFGEREVNCPRVQRLRSRLQTLSDERIAVLEPGDGNGWLGSVSELELGTKACIIWRSLRPCEPSVRRGRRSVSTGRRRRGT